MTTYYVALTALPLGSAVTIFFLNPTVSASVHKALKSYSLACSCCKNTYFESFIYIPAHVHTRRIIAAAAQLPASLHSVSTPMRACDAFGSWLDYR